MTKPLGRRERAAEDERIEAAGAESALRTARTVPDGSEQLVEHLPRYA